MWGHFCPLWVPIWRRSGPKYGYFLGQNQATMAGWFQGGDPTWKVFSVPYHTPMHGTTLFRPTFALSRHQSRVPGVQNMAISLAKTRPERWGCSMLDWPTWKVSGAPYHTPIHGRAGLRTIFTLSRHLSRVPGVQNMAILGVKTGLLWQACYGVRAHPGNRFMRHITYHLDPPPGPSPP